MSDIHVTDDCDEHHNDQLLRRPAVAKRLDVGVRTLERWARQGIGPRMVKVGPRAVRYRLHDVEAWLDGQRYGGEAVMTELPPPVEA